MKNRLIVGGRDLFSYYGLVLEDGYVLGPPKPKTYLLDLPGGDGSLDVTEAFGDVLYDNRDHQFVLGAINHASFEKTKTDVARFLHGRVFDYQITMDPGYIYRGRFAIDEWYSEMHIGRIKVKVSANPYKSAGVKVHEVDVQAGAHLVLKPGRGRVSPVFESKVPIHVISNGVDAYLPAGSHKAVGLSIRDGASNVYVNASDTGVFGGNVTWADLKDKTWGQIEGKKWNEVMWGNGAPPANASYIVRIAYEVLEL